MSQQTHTPPNSTEAQRQSFAVKLHEITETIFEMGIEDRPMTGNEYMEMMRKLKLLADECRVFQSHPITLYYERQRTRPARAERRPKSLTEKMNSAEYMCCPKCECFVKDILEHQRTAKCSQIYQTKHSIKIGRTICKNIYKHQQVINRLYEHTRGLVFHTPSKKNAIFNHDYSRWNMGEGILDHFHTFSGEKLWTKKLDLEYSYYYHSFHIQLEQKTPEEQDADIITVWRKCDNKWEWKEMTRKDYREHQREMKEKATDRNKRYDIDVEWGYWW